MRNAIKLLLLLVVAACLALAAVFSWLKLAPRHVPDGQAELVTLGPESLPGFREAFNDSEGGVRVLAMLSPT